MSRTLARRTWTGACPPAAGPGYRAPVDVRVELTSADRARRLGVSVAAVELTDAAEVVDLHVESFIWTRVFGYDLAAHHRPGPLGGRLLGQADLPRLREAGFTGAFLSVATNPFRRPRRRTRVAATNLARLATVLDGVDGATTVGSVADYRRARARGELACFLALQGGNAVPVDAVATLPDAVCRVTLVHLTPSGLGSPSSPIEWLAPVRGLSATGRAYVEALVARRVLVDLAHAGAATFWDALDVHGRSQPPIISHTAVRSVCNSWRNVDDSQIRAVADRGGVVGIMFHGPFLGEASAAAVVRHLARVIEVGGEEAAALGSDWDGLILPPPELRSAAHLPVLVQRMIDAGFGTERIQRVLGTNALRVLAAVRP